MSKSKHNIRYGHTTTNNTPDCAETTVWLVDDNGHGAGAVTLKTKPGSGLHYRFENAIKLMVKEAKYSI